jgi:hypothetical protein
MSIAEATFPGGLSIRLALHAALDATLHHSAARETRAYIPWVAYGRSVSKTSLPVMLLLRLL